MWQHSDAVAASNIYDITATPDGLLVSHGTQLDVLGTATGKSVASFTVPQLSHYGASSKVNAIYAYGIDSKQMPAVMRIR